MSAPKHTQGPWHWTEYGRLEPVDTAESRSIAVILNSDGCLVYRDAEAGWDDEQAANLALIAAAPCLLKAAKTALEWFESRDTDCNKDFIQVCCELREAIDQAEVSK